ncbi:MAG: adenine phosphoribosyltransferase [Mesorhizobium sp.]|nr:MAG: adenine phosphoribosyltransferase [Mesorhizobium sp.]
MKPSLEDTLLAAIRTIPDYPKPGILFRDITTLLSNARAFRRAIDELVHPYAGQKVDKIAGIEARGFILGGAVAHQLSAGFVPIRKKGKLPYETVRVAYSLEYGLDEMEMHRDGVSPGEKVILVDDLIATGGTAAAAALHLARTVARRAERIMVALTQDPSEHVNREAIRYINRVSDFLFVAARAVNDNGNADVLWVPGENR